MFSAFKLGKILIGFLAVILVAFALAHLRSIHFNGIFTTTDPVPTNIRTELLDKLKTISELHTGIAMVQTIITNSQGRKLLGMEFASTKLLYVAVGTVRAGVNLSELKPEMIQVEGKKIQFSLPPVRILESTINVEKSYCYDVRRSLILSPDAIGLQEAAQRKALEEVRAAAIQCGLLDMAGNQAKLVVTLLLQMAGFENIQVHVSSSPAAKGSANDSQ